MMDAKAKKRLWWQVPLGIFVVWALWKGPALMTTWRGVEELGLLEKPEMREYSASSEENLRAIRTAVMLYHDSEGGFPLAENWMDSIEVYIKTADLTEEEAKKKLQHPMFWDDPDSYGYAYNVELAGKFWIPDGAPIDDPDCVQDPENTVLIFDSKELGKNVSGDPLTLAPEPERGDGNKGITVAGEVVGLDSLVGQ